MTVAVVHSLLLLLQVADGFHVHLLRLGQHRRLASKESSRSTIGTSARFFDKDVSNHYRTQVDISECVVPLCRPPAPWPGREFAQGHASPLGPPQANATDPPRGGSRGSARGARAVGPRPRSYFG